MAAFERTQGFYICGNTGQGTVLPEKCECWWNRSSMGRLLLHLASVLRVYAAKKCLCQRGILTQNKRKGPERVSLQVNEFYKGTM